MLPPRRSASVVALRLAPLAAALALGFVGLTNHGLWTPDEPRVAAIGEAMLADGDLVVPRLAGQPFLEHPPLAWWLMAPSLRALGPTPGGARLPVGVACAVAVLLAADLAARLAGRRAGAAAGLVAATTGGIAWHGHRCVVDPWLMAAVTLGLWSLARALDLSRRAPPADRPPRPWFVLLAYAAAGLAFLTKGPVGVALLGVAGLALVATAGRTRAFLRAPVHAAGVALLAALVGAWPALLHGRGDGLLGQFLDDTLLRRIGSGGEGGGEHRKGPLYYLLQAPLLTLPWAVCLPAVARWLWARGRAQGGLLALTAAVPAGVALLSVPATKRPIYLLPLLPALAPVVAAWLVATRRRATALDRGTLLLLLVALPVVPVVGLGVALAVASGATFGQLWAEELVVGPGSLALLVALAGGALGLAFVGVRRWRARAPGVAAVVLWGAAWVALGHHALVYPLLDEARGPRRLVAALREACAGDAPPLGYLLDETTVAVAALELGVPLTSAPSLEALRAFVRERPGGRVLLFERLTDLLPDDVRARLLLRGRWALSTRRAYVVYEVAGPVVAARSGAVRCAPPSPPD